MAFDLKNNENFFVLGSFLAVIGIISGLLLAQFSKMVENPIKEANQQNINNAISAVLPPFDNHPSEIVAKVDFAGKTISFLGAFNKDELVGIVGINTTSGYSGEIEGMVGLKTDGKVRSVLITKQTETPGLGTEVCQRQFQKTIFNLPQPKPEGLAPNRILDQFEGLLPIKGTSWQLKADGGDIEYITGATVTARAVTKLVDEVAQCYIKNREMIISVIEKEQGGKK